MALNLKTAQRHPNPLHLVPHQSWRELEQTIEHLQTILWKRQEKDGHWHFALDDNITMNAEFILFHRWIDLDDEPLVQRLANGILDRQQKDGSWNIFYNGSGNLSTTVEAYLALRCAGYSAEHPALLKAKDFIIAQGGISASRVFTKIWLALFGLYPWEGIPVIPPEILLAPRGIPFHILEFSYWSRATIVPLTILFHLQKMKTLDFDVDELYINPAEKAEVAILPPPPADESWIIKSSKWDMTWLNWEQVFIAMSRGVSVYESKVPVKPLRKYCVHKARRWILARQEQSGDWAGIQPAMINGIMALHAMGMKLTDEPVQKGIKALHRFTRGVSQEIHKRSAGENTDMAILQSCVSPIWDTALSALGMIESGVNLSDPRLKLARDFLWKNRITHKGDWAVKAKLRRGKPFAAWCFQYHNTLNPDIDDSTIVTLTLHKLGMSVRELEPAIHWIYAMQGSDGGWGTFDRDNNQTILNRIPFADLKALIDPSNPDVTGHVLETLAELGLENSKAVKRGIRYLRMTQRPDGAWFGRWGVNLIYGTSAAIIGLTKCGEPLGSPHIQRAIKFILARQNSDGGWGESCDSYGLNRPPENDPSTPSQTAWALMALAQARHTSPEIEKAIERGVTFLHSRQVEDGLEEKEYTGTGFPQHFYLRYDGYRNYFPLIALGRLKG